MKKEKENQESVSTVGTDAYTNEEARSAQEEYARKFERGERAQVSSARRRKRKTSRCPMKGISARGWTVIIIIVVLIGSGVYFKSKGTSSSFRGLFSGMPKTVEDVDAKNAQQWGYAVGTVLGKQVAQMLAQAPGHDEMDMDMFMKGLSDAIKEDAQPLLSEEQVQKLLEQRLQMEREKAAAEAQENLKKSEKFVEEYAKKDDVHKLDNGTLYTVKEEGDGARVGDSDVQIHYRGTHITGEEFDSSRANGSDKPVTLNSKMVIPGFAEALKNMRVGDKWEIVIPADQAYGEAGMPPAGIGPNEALIFEVEVVGIGKDAVDNKQNDSDEEENAEDSDTTTSDSEKNSSES